jgi:chromosome segregation ATPase
MFLLFRLWRANTARQRSRGAHTGGAFWTGAHMFSGSTAKSLLIALEDENALLRDAEQRLTDEVAACRRQLAERDKALSQLTRGLRDTPLPERGEQNADVALLEERSQLAQRNSELQRALKTLEEELRVQNKLLAKALAEAAEERAAREESALEVSKLHEVLREKDAGARSAARSASTFAQSLVALESRVMRQGCCLKGLLASATHAASARLMAPRDPLLPTRSAAASAAWQLAAASAARLRRPKTKAFL